MNHSFSILPKALKIDVIAQDLTEITQKRFPDCTIVKTKFDQILFQCPKIEFDAPLVIWKERRKVVFRKQSREYIISFAEFVLCEELSKKYNGKVGDEALDERWDPNPDRYPTLKSYIKALKRL